MSNISKKPIIIKEGISVNILDGKVIVSGPKGTLTAMIPENDEISIENGEMRIGKVLSADFEKFAGLAPALLANMVEGVSRGVQKQLELSGGGDRARGEGGGVGF